MPTINLYAEVLTHLRQLTLHASLQTEKNEQTTVDISSDKKIITVIHDGESASLYLPTQISGTAQVTFPRDRKTEISARVQIEDMELWKETAGAGAEAPWNASELSSETSINCITCNFQILSGDTILSWKDLPNQNWAEVMDLWFCHKPHEHRNEQDEQDEHQAAAAKGFSANSRLVSQRGTGLVDLMSFALHPDDCHVFKTISTENGNNVKPLPVHCPTCRMQNGVFSVHDHLVRLDKSCLKVKLNSAQPPMSYNPPIFVASQLLELIESTATRKVVVYSQHEDSSTMPADEVSNTVSPVQTSADKLATTTAQDNQGQAASQTQSSSDTPLHRAASRAKDEPSLGQALLLWIFNPDIYYSSSRLSAFAQPRVQTTETKSSLSSDTRHSSRPTESSKSINSSQTEAVTTSLLPHRALKIFYKELSPSSLPSFLSPQPLSPTTSSTQHELLSLPPRTLASLHRTLEASTDILPAAARTFSVPLSGKKDVEERWSIGLLDRYERHPTAEKVMEQNPLARSLVAQTGKSGGGGSGLAVDGKPKVTRWEVEMPLGAEGLFS